MKNLIVSVFILFSLFCKVKLYAQDPVSQKQNGEEEGVFMVVEVMPEFPGGQDAMIKYLVANITYPELERKNGIQGMVVVKFIVEKDGSISHVKIVKGVTPNLNAEALRVVREMPRWTPGTQRGKEVRVTINLPIRFTLSGGKGKKDEGDTGSVKKLFKR